MKRGFFFLCLLLSQGCTEDSIPVPVGTWGGEGVVLHVEADGAVLEDLAGCFEGTIPQRLTMTASGRFAVDGVYVNFPLGSRPGISEPARFSGLVSGHTMSLTITDRESGQSSPPFLLRYGAAPSAPTRLC